ncbi:MAG: excinuclease ABC subunit UvrC [Deltaproteobacteria bacterium]|nr:excinuclease ABC subunit UvrC [Deltaproteobacteria bacterium]
MDDKRLSEILDALPRSPGVYLMKDPRGAVIYVGKAKNLHARVRSYFSPNTSDGRFFVSRLRALLGDIDLVLTTNEKEAILLESDLIKKHAPRYNVKLKDDKDFLSLRLDGSKPWPRLEIVRRPRDKGTTFFGPYHSASAARETVRVVNRHFRLRSCSDRAMASRRRPCLQHQIKRCPAPCVLEVDAEEYRRQVEFVELFLSGRRAELLGVMRERMEAASGAMDYERAAVYRDQIRAVEETLRPQTVTVFDEKDHDVVGLARHGDEVVVAVLEVRGGRIFELKDFHFPDQAFPDEEILSSFIGQRYMETGLVPELISVSRSLPDAAALSAALSERTGRKVRVAHAARGPRRARAEMADRNAEQALKARLRSREDSRSRLEEVRRALHLAVPPRRVECADISHLAGGDTVGAVSRVEDGRIDRARGRTYRLKGAGRGDDYGAMLEVVRRRFTRAAAGEAGWEAPDLLVVDGGRGQLRVAQEALSEAGVAGQAVVALAKDRGADEGDRIFLPGRKNPIPIKGGAAALLLLAMARDEAHRLAIGYQRKVRAKHALRSRLDDVPGLGPHRKARLLTQMGSVKRVEEASVEELEKIEGIGPGLARRIMEALARDRVR